MKNTNWLQVGLLMRGQVRRYLTKAGVEFTEQKGLLESVFVILDDYDFYAIKKDLTRQGVLN